MDIIHLLPDSVANQIAAGEVIQRPASCLKELVENSLDAGATDIQILVRDAGRTLLQVIDNGKGMSQTDARMAFERHATSKIQSASDLFSLHTMGFRGEALASICAVAQVEMTTRRQEDEVGTLLEISGSEVIRQELVPCTVGTNMKIKNLFFNVPARRRFLKTDSTELRNLLQDFYRIALVYPDIHFTFVSDDEILLDLVSTTTKGRIEQIFQRSQKKTYTQQLVDIRANTQIVNISGYIGKPESAGKGMPEYFFVNGRYMKHPYFHKAVMQAYQGTLQPDQMPAYFIYFDIAPEAIDVNIHPTKTEIKFADEQSIFQILLAAVRESLGKFNLTPSLDFNREGDIDIPQTSVAPVHQPEVTFNAAYNPFKSHQSTYQPPQNWQSLYQSPQSVVPQDDMIIAEHADEATQTTLSELIADETLRPVQVGQRYIAIATDNGLLLIDQHLAHRHVIYTQLQQLLQYQSAASQQLLFPDTIDLSPDQAVLLMQVKDDLAVLGFDIEAIGKTSFLLNGVPPQLNEQNGVKTLLDILTHISQTPRDCADLWKEQITLTLADDIAIPAGKKMTETEMLDLVRQLQNLSNLTADGKKISTVLTTRQISQLL